MRSAAVGGVRPVSRSITTSRPPRSTTEKRLGGGRSTNTELFLEREHRERGLRRFARSEEHTSELQSLMRISYAVFCLKKKKTDKHKNKRHPTHKNQNKE